MDDPPRAAQFVPPLAAREAANRFWQRNAMDATSFSQIADGTITRAKTPGTNALLSRVVVGLMLPVVPQGSKVSLSEPKAWLKDVRDVLLELKHSEEQGRNPPPDGRLPNAHPAAQHQTARHRNFQSHRQQQGGAISNMNEHTNAPITFAAPPDVEFAS